MFVVVQCSWNKYKVTLRIFICPRIHQKRVVVFNTSCHTCQWDWALWRNVCVKTWNNHIWLRVPTYITYHISFLVNKRLCVKMISIFKKNGLCNLSRFIRNTYFFTLVFWIIMSLTRYITVTYLSFYLLYSLRKSVQYYLSYFMFSRNSKLCK